MIAQELIAESDPERVLELSKELTLALDQQELGRRWRGQMADTTPSPSKNQESSDYEKIVEDAVALMRSDYASM